MTVLKRNEWFFRVIIFSAIIFFMIFLLKGSNTLGDIKAVQANADAEKAAPITLEFWAISSEDNKNEEILEQLVNRFNSQNSKIHVNLDMKSDGYFYKIYSAAMASKTNPDLGIMFSSQAAQFCDKGFLFALDHAVNNLIKGGMKFYPAVLEQANLYKQFFGIPFSIQNYVLLARKDILKKYKLDTPANMTELLEALRVLSTKGQAGLAIPTKGYLAVRSLLYFILVNGGRIFESDGSIQLASEKNSEVYSFFHTLSRENLVYNKKSQLSINEVANLFTKGEAAFILTTPTTLNGIYGETDKEFIENVEIVTLKGFDDVFYTSGPVFVEVLSVFKNCEHKDEAQVFAEWLCNHYSKLWPQYPYDEIPAVVMDSGTVILNEKFTKGVFQTTIAGAKYPSYPKESSVNYIVMEGTDALNGIIRDLYSSKDIGATIEAYQKIAGEWSIRFNR